ncbi:MULTISPECIES: hypothetical protein [unclassified Okeania]|uniref:hypothetical protein n=1 Tax=unclassified Okeania TaxID=2634635 RepID=UPI0013BFFFBF|nr:MULTISPECIES: hypothetical protein [unclassified Okeania]NET26343.1 hypothetical protein [Okeania sp. SIO1I7]NET46445.1 hypothetical protein [Okeania sp. SIO2B3]
MPKENPIFPIVIENSPIDFILIGLKEDDLCVLVKNDKLTIDFIGEYIARYENREKPQPTTWWNSLLKLLHILSSAKVYCIKSYAIENLLNKNDERSINYIFCWRGRCRKKDIYSVKEILNLQIQSIQLSLINNDKEKLIWHLAPIIYKCTQIENTNFLYNIF